MTEEAKRRKELPIYEGFVKYFPDAMLEVAKLSKIANDQHNPRKPMFWDRTKSKDELDALMRHLIDRAKGDVFDTDKQRHLTKVAWRGMAALQKELENANKNTKPN